MVNYHSRCPVLALIDFLAPIEVLSDKGGCGCQCRQTWQSLRCTSGSRGTGTGASSVRVAAPLSIEPLTLVARAEVLGHRLGPFCLAHRHLAVWTSTVCHRQNGHRRVTAVERRVRDVTINSNRAHGKDRVTS